MSLPTPSAPAPSSPPASTAAAARWSWRAASSPSDDDFLDALYVSTRLDEVLSWGFSPLETAAFLVEQARLQRRAHGLTARRAEHRILLVDGAPAGRLVVTHPAEDRGGGGPVAIVDLSVLPPMRGRGLATWALSSVLDGAGAAGRPVELRVEPRNPARRLYERLGFRAIAEDDLHVHMRWTAAC